MSFTRSATVDSSSGGISRRIFVGNLPYQADADAVKRRFVGRARGLVKVDIIINRDGRSAGAAVLEFASPRDAMNAIGVIHNSDFDGRLVYAREDREDPELKGNAGGFAHSGPVRAPLGSERQQRMGGRGGGPPVRLSSGSLAREQNSWGGGGFAAASGGTSLFVRNIAFGQSEEEVRALFNRLTAPTSISIPMDARGMKGHAVVRYATSEDASQALSVLQGYEFSGRPLEARYDER